MKRQGTIVLSTGELRRFQQGRVVGSAARGRNTRPTEFDRWLARHFGLALRNSANFSGPAARCQEREQSPSGRREPVGLAPRVPVPNRVEFQEEYGSERQTPPGLRLKRGE